MSQTSIRFTDSQVHHHLQRLNCHGLATWLMWSRSLQKRGLHVQGSDLPTTLTGLQQRCPNEHPIRPTCVGATRQTSGRWISLLRSQADLLPRNQLRAQRQLFVGTTASVSLTSTSYSYWNEGLQASAFSRTSESGTVMVCRTCSPSPPRRS